MIRPVILANCLVEKEGRYLLVQQAKDKKYGDINTHSKGKWSLPHGEVDEGETVVAAAERELLEETGGKTCLVKLGAVVQASVDDTVCLLSFIFCGNGLEMIRCRCESEISAIGWFSTSEILKLEAESLVRDAVPINRIIEATKQPLLSLIEWEQPDYTRAVLRKML